MRKKPLKRKKGPAISKGRAFAMRAATLPEQDFIVLKHFSGVCYSTPMPQARLKTSPNRSGSINSTLPAVRLVPRKTVPDSPHSQYKPSRSLSPAIGDDLQVEAFGQALRILKKRHER